MTKVGVLHENARISRRFWRKLISLRSILTDYNHLYFLLFKGAIYLISILQQACICFYGNGKKEVKLIHVFKVYKTWRPYQVLAVYKYAIIPTTIGKTCLKVIKITLVINLVTPPTLNVYKCFPWLPPRR